MSTTVEQIKSRLSIVDVVSSYMKLSKAGINYKGLCPFHNEKSPSFSVSLERGTFHCFGCGKGGDAFTFVQEIEGLDFMGALHVLAERAGVEVVYGGKKEDRDEKEQMYTILSQAADFFHAELVKNKEALVYLKKRGLDAKTAEDFYLGFAPDAWDELHKHLSKEKYTGEEMEKAGLVLRSKEGRRGWYDRFRSRIMFPISDSAGRTVGFSGRIFLVPSGVEGGKEEGAKYVNSPETLLYNKSRILYGLDVAKKGIREHGFALLVEGQMDIILSHQIGLTNTVAVSGTALTEEHLLLLKRFADKVVFGFDGDGAGLLATKRGALLALRIGMEPLAAEIPEGKDPADFARESPEEWKKSVKNAEHVVPFFLKILKRRAKDVGEFRAQARKEVLPLIAAIRSPIEQEHFMEVLSKEISISQEAIRLEMRGIATSNQISQPAQTSSSVMAQKNTVKIKQKRSDMIGQELFAILLWQKEKPEPDVNVSEVLEKYNAIAGSVYCEVFKARLESVPVEEKRALVFSAEKMYSGAIQRSLRITEELLLRFEEALLNEEREEITQKLSDGRISENNDLETRHIQISRRLEEIKKILSEA